MDNHKRRTMREKIEQMYIQALIDDLPPNVFADQVLRLFNVVGRRELLIDFCSKVEESLEMYGHLAPNEAYIDEYLKGN